MWSFTTSSKRAKDSAAVDDLELPPPTEIVQTSIDPAVLPYLGPEDQILDAQRPQTYPRMGLNPLFRIKLMAGLTGAVGFLRGLKKGSDIAILCYRAENAHLTPTSKAGWFLYNKSKNYHGITGGVKEGCKTGARYFGWAALFISLEGGLDAARGRVFASRKEDENNELRRGQADFLNTVSAAVAVAGIHSWWNGLDRFAAGRLTRGALRVALPFGLAQDLLSSMRGENAWYIDGISRLIGRGGEDSVSKLGTKQT